MDIKINKETIKSFIRKKPEKTLYQFLRYLVAGGTATLVDLSVLFVLYQLLGVNYLIAAAISFCCGIFINFTINVIFVFESSGSLKKEFLLFASVSMGGLLWTEIILWSLSNKLGLPVMAAKFVAIAFVLFWNFFMRKFLVFKKNT